jgi:hypothetical protein
VNAAHVRWVLAAAAVSCALVLLGPPHDLTAAARDGGLTDRLAAYAEQFGREFQGVVATEHSVQVIRPWTGVPPARPDVSHREALARRVLRSDLLLVFDADGPWHLHRDVHTVDGTPVAVHDRERRLRSLFVEPGLTTRERLRRMTVESARYNLGDITRTLNIPTFPLVVVHPAHRDRFRLRVRGTRRQDGAIIRELTFDETRRPTVVRATDGRDVPLRGRLLVDETTGAFIHARLDPEPRDVRSRIEVWFEEVPGLSLRVPVRMWEWYRVQGVIRDGRDAHAPGFQGAYIEALASYSEFKRYEVDVDERLGPR